MRSPRRSPVNGDAVLVAAALERLGMELGGIVDADPARLTLHGPIRGHLAQREPGRLVHGGVRQTEPHRGRRRRFQRDVKASDTAAVRIYGNRDPGPANRLSIDGVDQHQVHRRVIDLHEVKWVAGRRRMAIHRIGLRVLFTTAAEIGQRQRLQATADGVR